MPSTPQQDLIDDLLVDYLAALDLYQAAQDRLARSLKQGFFDLARAKQVLGPTKLSQSGYDLGETLSRVQVDITASPERREGEAGSDDPDEIQAWTLSPSASSLTPSPTPAPPSASSLRQRTGKLPTSETLSPSPRTPSSPPAPTPPSASKSAGSGSEEMPAPLPRSLSRSPLLQFSAFPPPALRAAEGGFGRAAKESVAVVEARGRVEALEKRVERARQGLAAEKV